MGSGRTFSNVVSAFMCCWFPQHDDSEHEPATLRTLQPPSAVSMALPSSAVPHGATSRNDASDARALREIFSSSSSVRGYQAATPLAPLASDRSASFDANFKFGSTSPEKKPGGRLEQLGHHIRQKLSESRLSKSSSKTAMRQKQDDTGVRHLPSTTEKKQDEQNLLFSTSQRSTGLGELLMSRAASQGGYDSDAKSIETAMLRSNAGTIKVSPGFVRHALGNIDMAHEGSSTMADSQSQNDDIDDTAESHVRDCSQSSPVPQTPSKTAFSTALQMNNGESPSDVLRRVSIGLANGTIKLPDTPEIRAMQMPNIIEDGQNWKLSFTAPRRASSLKKSEEGVQEILRTLNDRVESAKRASVASIPSEKHLSLVSDLDPTFVQYLQKYGKSSSPAYAGGEIKDYTGTSPRNSSVSLSQSNIAPRSQRVISESDKESIHLFNMRISQRLASNSLMPVLSPSKSNIGSFKSQSVISEQRENPRTSSSYARFPSFIHQEHNRRPSDPQTRRLFENGNVQNFTQPRWNGVASVSSVYSNSKTGQVGLDDASSFYASENGLSTSGAASPANLTRRNSVKSPCSLAVGGRSVSGGFLGKHGSIGQLASATEAAWLRSNEAVAEQVSEDSNNPDRGPKTPGRQRSISLPAIPTPVRFNVTPTPKGRRLSSTHMNEGMSETSTDVTTKDRKNEAFSELNGGLALDRRNEGFSEEDYSHLQGGYPAYSESRRLSSGWLSDGRRSGWGFNFVDKSAGKKLRVESSSQHEDLGERPWVYESTTNMWERAIKRARKEELTSSQGSGGGLLAVSKFDRLGRRKSTTCSSDTLNRSHQEQARRNAGMRLDSSEQSRSREDSGNDPFRLERYNSMWPAPRTPLLKAKNKLEGGHSIPKESQTMKEKGEETPRKRSILDLRRFTTMNLPGEMVHGSGTPTSARMFLANWAKFPSHTRAERNGAADQSDGIRIKDFSTTTDEKDAKMRHSRMSLFDNPGSFRSSAIWERETPGSWNLSSLRKNRKRKTASILEKDRRTSDGASRQKRKGFLRSIKKLYRSRSAEFRGFAEHRGHRSSISMSGNVEYPELEIVPGVIWRTDTRNKDLDLDRKDDESVDQQTSSDDTRSFRPEEIGNLEGDARKSKNWLPETTREDDGESLEEEREATSLKIHSSPKRSSISLRPSPAKVVPNAEMLGKLYRSCVARNGTHFRRSPISPKKEDPPAAAVKRDARESEELRASTVDFESQLNEEMGRVSKELLRRVDLIGGMSQGEGAGSEDVLEMPPKITECGLGEALGKKGSCEDVSFVGGVDGV